MEIIVLDGYTLNPGDLSWAELEALGSLTVYDRTPPEEITARIGNAEIILINKTPITRETLEACPRLRYIGVLATGYNVVDTAAARAQGVTVCNVPTYGTAAVAQYVFALLLELCHRVGAHDASVKAGQWSASPDFCYWNAPLTELAGKTMGFLGFGRIGRAAGRIAAALELEVLACDALPCDEGLALARYVPLEELLARSDVLSLHCPLLPETAGIINRDSIRSMKPGAMLINTARGPLINDADLADALNSGRLAGAALDVVSQEPILPGNPLLTAKNCIITPHIAWAPKESRGRLIHIAAQSLRAYLAGSPVHVVS